MKQSSSRTEMSRLNISPEDDSSSVNSTEYTDCPQKVPLGGQCSDTEAESQNFLPEHNLGKKKYDTEYHQGNASFGMSVFNLGNAIMGSGILALSYAMANTGIALFVILLVSVAIFSLYSVHLLLKTQLGYKAFGMPGKLAASCSITMQNIGVTTIPGQKTVAHASVVLACSPSGYLGYTSGLSLLCMVFFLIVVIIKKFQLPCPLDDDGTVNKTISKVLNATVSHRNTSAVDYSEDSCTPKYFVFNSQTVYAVPILTFAFVCHPAILPMYEELKDRSRQKMQGVANVSFLAMFIMYLLAALFGYLTFNVHVEPELLHTYSKVYESDVLLLIVRLAVLTAVTLTVPVVLFPVSGKEDFSWIRHTIITVVLLGFTNALVIFVPTIRDIFGFIGASAAAMLIFILPSAFYIKLVKKESMKSVQKIGATAFLLLGFFVMIGSMTLIVLDWIHNASASPDAHADGP
uniref:Sodium-coupled neutral amino acid symporter 2 n=1 Tax=Gasterosteus aculeatus aculeatus TaxID=481459 RepID=G3Q7D8_GASAC